MDRKKIILIVVGIIILVIIAVGIVKLTQKDEPEDTNTTGVINEMENVETFEEYVSELDDGTRLNSSEKMKETKKYKNLEISNVQLTEKNGSSVILADITNKGDTKQEVEEVNISILDKEGKEITKLGGVIGEIEPGGTIKLNVAVSANIINANDIIIEEKV